MEALKKLGYVLIITAFTLWIGYMIFIYAAIFTGRKKHQKKVNKTTLVDTVRSKSDSLR